MRPKKEKQLNKISIPIPLIFLLFIIFITGCKDEKLEKLPAVKVVLAKPVYMLFQEKVGVQGNVKPKDHVDIRICAKVEGTLNILRVLEGEHVKKGQLLFQTDKINLQNKVEIRAQSIKLAETAVKRAEVQLQRSKIKLENAHIDYKRARILIAKNAISATSYEKIELAWKDSGSLVKLAEVVLEHSKASLEQTRGNYAIAKKQLQDSMVKAPFSGVITHKYIEEGEYAKKGSPVLKLEDPELLETSLLISSKYYNRIFPGKTPVEIISSGKKHNLMGKVSYKSPSIDSITRTFEVKIDLPHTNGFVTGMLCSVNLILSSRDAYGVPNEALMLKSNHKYVVFTVVKNKAKMLLVKPGITDNNFTELIDAKNLADTEIVVQGQSFLNNGALVRILKKQNDKKKKSL